MKPAIFSIIFICFTMGLSAQANFTEKMVTELFDKPEKIKWIKYYYGRMDDLNDVCVTLAFDGKHCKGQMVYLKSRERLRLDGTIKGNKLKLKEINHAAMVSGQLEGVLDGSNLILDWSNYDHSIGGTIRLKETPQEVFTVSDCGDNKWFRTYRGIIFGSQVELIIQKDSETGIRGSAWFEKDETSYKVKGDLINGRDFKIAMKDNYNKLKGTLEGSINENKQISAHFFKADGQKCPSVFSMEEQMQMGCKEFADYISGYDIIYPRTSNHSFNYWIEGLSKKWVQSCEDYAGTVKARCTTADPKLRASVRSYAWSDLDLFNDRLISGFLTYSNPWEMGQQGRAFTYDFEKQKEITFEDIFENDFDAQRFLKRYLAKHITAHELYQDYDFRQWLARQDFPFFTLKREGITFSTPFDMVYGKQDVTIPYEALQDYIKQDSPISHLVK